MTQVSGHVQQADERYATLLNNAGAVRALCTAVEGTLGPKGLDVMLVNGNDEAIITNDGVTILEKMDVSHPTAKLLIQVAQAQQYAVGDGTTTATILANALVQEGVAQVLRGVPVTKVVAGVRQGIEVVCEQLKQCAIQVTDWDDERLHRTVEVAGRQQMDIVQLVLAAGQAVGWEQLQKINYRYADSIVAHEKAENEWFHGILLKQKPVQREWLLERINGRILVLQDSLEPFSFDEQLLTTESGFQQYMKAKTEFMQMLEQLRKLDVVLIVLERSIHPDAEQYCLDHDMMVVQRVNRQDIAQVCRVSGTKPLKRAALAKQALKLEPLLGHSACICYDERLECVRIYRLLNSDAKFPFGLSHCVTLLVGARTREIVGERARIAHDAASTLQTAIQGGIVPGGGTTELALSYWLERYRETVIGMESFGMFAVAQALQKPMTQILLNAGFNPLEKLEQVRAAQLSAHNDALGIHCDTGILLDYAQASIYDPVEVKVQALCAAGEVAVAVLRIHTVIKTGS